jgi:uncharacterized protein YcbK (DUF882 family)
MNTKLKEHVSRRTFLKWSTSALITGVLSSPAMSSLPPLPRKSQILSLYNIHTREVLETCYRTNGKLVPHALQQIDSIMRDHRTGEVKPVDPELLDLLYRIVIQISPDSPVNIISGYRSPKTNAALRKRTTGVAKKSLHMQGRAIDIRIPGFPTPTLRELAIDMRSGGVGYYPKSDFVHLDTGRFRTW